MSNSELRLTDATNREIDQGRRELKEGKGITTKELIRKLHMLNVKHRKHAYK